MYDWAELRHFKYLLAILEKNGFRAAADVLHTTQPNLSAQAKQFQENSGLHLYQLSKSGRIRLTPTGVAFRMIAKGLLDARDEAMAALLAVERGEVRTLRLGCSSQADPILFHAFCALHKELLPDCPIRSAHGDIVQLVAEINSGEIDAAIVTLGVPTFTPRVTFTDPEIAQVGMTAAQAVDSLRRWWSLAEVLSASKWLRHISLRYFRGFQCCKNILHYSWIRRCLHHRTGHRRADRRAEIGWLREDLPRESIRRPVGPPRIPASARSAPCRRHPGRLETRPALPITTRRAHHHGTARRSQGWFSQPDRGHRHDDRSGTDDDADGRSLR